MSNTKNPLLSFFALIALFSLACQSSSQADARASAAKDADEADPDRVVRSGGEDGLPPEPGEEAGGVQPGGVGSDASPKDEGEACGGMMGLTCAEPLFCQTSIEAQCGAADQMGVCRTRPEMCTKDYRPVCGCDGKTHPNECSAHSVGVSAATEGPCPGDAE